MDQSEMRMRTGEMDASRIIGSVVGSRMTESLLQDAAPSEANLKYGLVDQLRQEDLFE